MTDSATSPAPNPKSIEASFIQHCLNAEYHETLESRSWHDSPEIRRVLDPLNDRRYTDACLEAEKILPTYPDFDLIYCWYTSALAKQKRFDQAVSVAREGLARSKRKFKLCVKLGEIAWETGNLADCVYWWAQAWHCQETLPDFGSNESAFLFLYYISTELKLIEIAESLIQRVDQIRNGQVRLEVNTASTLRSLVRASSTLGIQIVLSRMAEKYLGIKAVRVEGFETASLSSVEISWAPGQVLETPGRLEIGLIAGLIWEEDGPRASLGGAWVIPCLKVEAQLYQVKMTLAQKTTSSQACIFEALPPGEYLIAYNPFPVGDQEGYRYQWDGKLLDLSSPTALLSSLSMGGELMVDFWPGPRGGTVQNEAGLVLEIKANTAVGVRGRFPLVVEFLADHEPYTIRVKPAQTSHLNIRSHACMDDALIS
jgi:hypothetical protein